MKIHPYGDGALYIDLEIDDAPDRQRRTQAVARTLRDHLASADIVIGAGSIAIVGVGAWDDLDGVVRDAMQAAPPGETFVPRAHVLRTVYDGADLDEIAQATGLSKNDVIDRHAAATYVVDLIGFLPGFAYLSGLDARLVVARKSVPRPRIPKNALAIAGAYTGIYPGVSPGGWHLIGRVTDVELFDPARTPPALFEPGDTVRFAPWRPD